MNGVEYVLSAPYAQDVLVDGSLEDPGTREPDNDASYRGPITQEIRETINNIARSSFKRVVLITRSEGEVSLADKETGTHLFNIKPNGEFYGINLDGELELNKVVDFYDDRSMKDFLSTGTFDLSEERALRLIKSEALYLKDELTSERKKQKFMNTLYHTINRVRDGVSVSTQFKAIEAMLTSLMASDKPALIYNPEQFTLEETFAASVYNNYLDPEVYKRRLAQVKLPQYLLIQVAKFVSDFNDFVEAKHLVGYGEEVRISEYAETKFRHRISVDFPEQDPMEQAGPISAVSSQLELDTYFKILAEEVRYRITEQGYSVDENPPAELQPLINSLTKDTTAEDLLSHVDLFDDSENKPYSLAIVVLSAFARGNQQDRIKTVSIF